MKKRLTFKWEIGLAALAILSSWAAFKVDSLGGLVIVYLLAMFGLAFSGTPRRAFYWGLFVGTATAAIHLTFFAGLFKTGALALWAIIGLWLALFTLLARKVQDVLPRYGILLIPFIWVGLEYFRSELYPLKFSWLAPGMALSHPAWQPMASLGFYGFSFAILTVCVLFLQFGGRRRLQLISATAALVVVLGLSAWSNRPEPAMGPYVAGIQLEFALEEHILRGLDNVLKAHPDADIVVLSEYSFQGPVPGSVLDWCRKEKRYLIAGGKDITGEGNNDFLNTIYVVSPEGDVIHKQVKSVPIQFFTDGAPATEQQLWQSPWGPIGLAVCYDLSYSRVIDRLVADGAQALIVPTMDVETWGEAEHVLHSKVPYVRACEYNIPIFRVASSGISQLVDADGRTLSSAPFPGPAAILGGQLAMSSSARVPLLRLICLPSVFITALAIVWICLTCFPRRKQMVVRGDSHLLD